MSSRHWRCSPGVEPRLAARHLAKNPPPATSPQGLASDARSLAASSLPGVGIPHATAHSLPPASATDEASYGVCLAPCTVDLRAYSSAIAPTPSPGTTPYSCLLVFSPSQFPFPANMRILGCLTFGGHSKVLIALIALFAHFYLKLTKAPGTRRLCEADSLVI